MVGRHSREKKIIVKKYFASSVFTVHTAERPQLSYALAHAATARHTVFAMMRNDYTEQKKKITQICHVSSCICVFDSEYIG